MTNSQLFKQAHAMAKQVIKSGDNYQVTFGLCLKAIKAEAKSVKPTFLQVILFALLVLIQNVLDSEKALRLCLPKTFNHFDNTNFDNCAISQRMLKDFEEQEKSKLAFWNV